MKIELIRDDETLYSTYGKLFVDGKYFAETLEDADRYLENEGNQKIPGSTAIPRGEYRVILSMSARFGRIMPEVLDVPGFKGIRIHGGNTEADTEGCPLIGAARNSKGISNCAGVNERLHNAIEAAINAGDEVTLQVS